MSKKQVRNAHSAGQILTRRAALAYGAFAATSLYLPGGLIRSAYAQAVSFDYFIGPNGSDSNPGTQAQPWSITAINTKRSTYAGKTVGLLDGTYDLIAIMGQPTSTFSTGSLAIAGGSASSPTVVRAVNPRMAIIDWNRDAQTNSSTGASFQPSGDYVTIDGLVLANNNYRSICNYGQGGSHFTVKNCLFTGQSYTKGPTGANSCMIYTQDHDNILISNCRFEGGGAPVDSGRHACIQSYQTSRNVVIEYCSFIAGSGTGNIIHFKQGGNYSPTVRNCYLDRSASTNSTSQYVIQLQGQNTDPSDRAQFHNNVLISGGGHTIFYVASPGFAGTFDIHHNTFVGPWSGSGCFAHMDKGSPIQTNIYENIWHRSSGGAGQYGDVSVYSAVTVGQMDRNYYPSSPVIGVGVGSLISGLTSWQVLSGKDTNSLTGSDAGFVAQGSDAAFYRIKSGSPCKSLGTGGTEIGAWGGANQIGSSFGGGVVLPAPVAPQLIGVD